MKVILRENISSLGSVGETKEVKNGYANNYLFPQKLAYPATKSYLKIFENEKSVRSKLKKKRHKRIYFIRPATQ